MVRPFLLVCCSVLNSVFQSVTSRLFPFSWTVIFDTLKSDNTRNASCSRKNSGDAKSCQLMRICGWFFIFTASSHNPCSGSSCTRTPASLFHRNTFSLSCSTFLWSWKYLRSRCSPSRWSIRPDAYPRFSSFRKSDSASLILESASNNLSPWYSFFCPPPSSVIRNSSATFFNRCCSSSRSSLM